MTKPASFPAEAMMPKTQAMALAAFYEWRTALNARGGRRDRLRSRVHMRFNSRRRPTLQPVLSLHSLRRYPVRVRHRCTNWRAR